MARKRQIPADPAPATAWRDATNRPTIAQEPPAAPAASEPTETPDAPEAATASLPGTSTRTPAVGQAMAVHSWAGRRWGQVVTVERTRAGLFAAIKIDGDDGGPTPPLEVFDQLGADDRARIMAAGFAQWVEWGS